MVHAHELRIGNLVMFGINKEPQRVFKIDYTIKDGHLVNGQVPEDHVHPIPLSPELLEKCGFKEKEVGAGFSSKEYRIDLFVNDSLYLRPYYEGGFIWGFNDGVEIGSPKPILYLHQLINFFHALTGSEIEVNL